MAPLDERISLIRSTLKGGGRPLLELPNRNLAESGTLAERDQEDDGLPRGQAKRRAYKFLQTHPKAGYRELAAGVAGRYDTSSYSRIRNLVLHMKRAGSISGTPGGWILGKGGHSAPGRSVPVRPEPSPKSIRSSSGAGASPVPLRKSSGNASAGRKLQGQYLGALRGLRPRARAWCKKSHVSKAWPPRSGSPPPSFRRSHGQRGGRRRLCALVRGAQVMRSTEFRHRRYHSPICYR